jgi:hypothetical protein
MTWCHMYLQYEVRLQLTYFVSSSFQLILTIAHWFLYNVVAKNTRYKYSICVVHAWSSPTYNLRWAFTTPILIFEIVTFILHVLSYSFHFNGYVVLRIILWLLLSRVSSRRVISGPTLKYKMANSGVYSQATTIRWVCYKVTTCTFV